MPNQLSQPVRNTQKATSVFATAPTQGMFQSRPFVVQTQRENNVQQPDLKISLTQTENYGHHLSKVDSNDNQATAGVPSPTVVQPKINIQSVMPSQSFERQTTNDSLSSKPMQMVYGKEERVKAKEFNQAKKQKLKEIKDQSKGPKDVKELKNQKKRQKQNPVTDKFAKDHVSSSETSMSSDSTKVGQNRTWGNKDSGKSTVVSMNKQDQQNEQRFALEERKMNETNFAETGALDSKMGVNKPTKFSYPTLTSDVTSDKQGNREVEKGRQELGQPILGMKGDQIHHLHGVKNEE